MAPPLLAVEVVESPLGDDAETAERPLSAEMVQTPLLAVTEAVIDAVMVQTPLDAETPLDVDAALVVRSRIWRRSDRRRDRNPVEMPQIVIEDELAAVMDAEMAETLLGAEMVKKAETALPGHGAGHGHAGDRLEEAEDMGWLFTESVESPLDLLDNVPEVFCFVCCQSVRKCKDSIEDVAN